MKRSDQILLCDTSLRDGLQAPDIYLDSHEQLDIAINLAESGIDELETGIPAAGFEFRSLSARIKELYPDLLQSCWCRAREADITRAAESKTDIVNIGVPASPPLLNGMQASWDEIRDNLPRLLEFALKRFARVSVGIMDSFRTPAKRINGIIQLADSLGLYRVRISDTVGTALPESCYNLVARLADRYLTPLAFHAHNDLGLATANSLRAAEAGARWIDATINGTGERAGNTPLEEIAAVISLHPRLKTNFRTSSARALSVLMSNYSGRALPINKPICGDLIFTHSSGIHCQGLRFNPQSYQPFSPEFCGHRPMAFVAGAKSGRHGIKTMLADAGIQIDSDELEGFTQTIRNRANRERRSFSVQDLASEYHRYHRYHRKTS